MLNAWDAWLLTLINIHLYHPAWFAAMAVITRLGDVRVAGVAVIVGGLGAWRRCRREVIAGGLGFLMTLAVTDRLKRLLDRPRPSEVLDGLHVIGALHGQGFPSGHAAAAAGMAMALSVWWPRGRWGWWGLAGLVAWSRIVVGVHYPSDCLGGALLGALLVWGTIQCVRRSR